MKYKNICKGVENVCKAYKLTILKEIGKPITPLIEVNSWVFLIKEYLGSFRYSNGNLKALKKRASGLLTDLYFTISKIFVA